MSDQLSAFAEADLTSELSAFQAALERRKRDKSRPRSFVFDPAMRNSLPKDAFVPLPGYVTLLLARRGTTTLSDLEEWWTTSNGEALSNFSKWAANAAETLKQVTPQVAVANASEAASILNFSYGTDELASNVSLPPQLSFAFLMFPYAGNAIDIDQFVITELLQTNGRRGDTEVLVVIAPPEQGSLELAVQSLVSNATVIGTRPTGDTNIIPTTVVVGTIFLYEAGVAAYAYTNSCGCRVQSYAEEKLKALRARVGREPSLDDLVRIRQEALKSEGIL